MYELSQPKSAQRTVSLPTGTLRVQGCRLGRWPTGVDTDRSKRSNAAVGSLGRQYHCPGRLDYSTSLLHFDSCLRETLRGLHHRLRGVLLREVSRCWGGVGALPLPLMAARCTE